MKIAVTFTTIILVVITSLVMTISLPANQLDSQTMQKLVGGICYAKSSNSTPGCTNSTYRCVSGPCWQSGTVVQNRGQENCQTVSFGKARCWYGSAHRIECYRRTSGNRVSTSRSKCP